MELANKWRELRRLDYLPIEYVFEKGDAHVDQLSKMVRQHHGKSPIFKPKREEGSERGGIPLTPLQVGDFAAYEIGKFYGVVDRDNDGLFERLRVSFDLLRGMTNRWGQWTYDTIRPLLNFMHVNRRTR